MSEENIHISLSKQLKGAMSPIHLSVDFTLLKGKVTALIGKSGSGKTSILRMIAGLMRAKNAEISIESEVWESTSKKSFKSPQKRSLGFVFQDYSLFPNMTVEENLQFALPKHVDKKEVSHLLDVIQLQKLKKNKPQQLSGGQKQRVALSRAFIRRPKLLLLDEPLSALDTEMREHLQHYLTTFREEFPVTTLLVSHNTAEIASLAQYVFVLDNGKIIKEGTPLEVLPKLVNELYEVKGKVIALNHSNKCLTLLTNQGIITLPIPKKVRVPIELHKELTYNIDTKSIK